MKRPSGSTRMPQSGPGWLSPVWMQIPAAVGCYIGQGVPYIDLDVARVSVVRAAAGQPDSRGHI
jgi:hypothetical protein